MTRATLAIAVLLGAMGVSDQAIAVSQARTSQQTAVEGCQAALPNFEGALRKRPLGIVNEGSNTAFVSCGLSFEVSASSPGVNGITIFMTNTGATNVNVTCTLVNKVAPQIGQAVFIMKNASLAGGNIGINWGSTTDNQGNLFKHASISCAIPPGVEINATETRYFMDVGL